MSRGASLVELMIAMGVALIILGATYQLYFQAWREGERPRASMQLQEDMAQVARRLRRELEETNVQTIVTAPPRTTHTLQTVWEGGRMRQVLVTVTSPGGVSFASPRDPAGQLVMGEFGVVRWQAYTYYAVVPSGPGTGNLVRREGPLTDQGTPRTGDSGRRIPLTSDVRPEAARGGRVVARGVPLSPLGFYVYFEDDAGGRQPFTGRLCREPVCVELVLRQTSTVTGKTSELRHVMRVLPRN